MEYDIIEERLVLEDSQDGLDYVLTLIVSDLDESTLDRLAAELECEDERRMTRRGTNFNMAMEFYPKMLSKEATDVVLDTLEMSPGDFPDAEIEV